MTKIHFILNGKGGVGKSFISSLLCQYLMSKKQSVTAIDTDPNNVTLYNIKALKAKFLQLIDNNGKFNVREFDKIAEATLEKKSDNYVIDSGATTFIPLIDYLKDSLLITMFKENEIDVFMHVPIVGGQGRTDTITGLSQLMDNFESNFIVWINEYHGTVDFENTKEYETLKDKIKALIYLNNLNKDTFGKDLLDLTSKNLTFDEAMQDKSFSLMSKQRLKIFKDRAFKQLDIIL